MLRSDGSYIRDNIFMDDVVLGYLLLLQHINRAPGERKNSYAWIEVKFWYTERYAGTFAWYKSRLYAK